MNQTAPQSLALHDNSRAQLISSDSSTQITLTSDPATPRDLTRCPTSSPYPHRNCKAAARQSMSFEFASLSPERAKEWEEAENSRRAADLKIRLEREMAQRGEDSLDAEEFGDVNTTAPLHEARSHWEAKYATTEVSSGMSSQPKSTPPKHHNWDIDTLLDEHMKEIDDCDFGSLNHHHLLGRQQQHPIPKHQQRLAMSQQPLVRQQRKQTNKNNMKKEDIDFNHDNSNGDIKHQVMSPSKMMQITLSDDQSSVSSPGWSTSQQLPMQTSRNQSRAMKPTNPIEDNGPLRTTNAVNIQSLQPLKLQPTSLPTPSTISINKKEQDLQLKLHSLQLQLNQLTSLNSTLHSRIDNDKFQIQQLSSSEEEARQEAALWEAKWRDDHNGSVLLPELRGALLQKTKEDMRDLQSKLIELQRSTLGNSNSVKMNLLVSENEALRNELANLSDGILASSPSSAVQRNFMERLDYKTKTSHESEQKWVKRIKDVEEKMDLVRKENKVLVDENERLKQDIEIKPTSEEGKKLRELELKLSRDRGEIDRLVKEKSALVEELRTCRDMVDKARADHGIIRNEFEIRLKEQTELHSAEMEKFWGRKPVTVDRGSDATPFNDEKLETALAQASQENITLQEENAGVSAENERLAKRCVDLERSMNEATSTLDDVRLALQNAECRIEQYEREKGELEESMREIEQQVAASMSNDQAARRGADQASAEKESIQQLLQSVLREKEQNRTDLQSLRREIDTLLCKNTSLEKYQMNAQEELRLSKLAKEELNAELSATMEENAMLKKNNLSMKERLDERQLLLDTIRKNDIDGPLAEENRLLKTSLSGLENQLRSVENALETERTVLSSTTLAREQAEKRIGELNIQIKSLQNEVNSAHAEKSIGREEQLRLERQANEMKSTISSLRDEISAAAIARSQLELELRQRQDECATFQKQLDPLQQEKYRLELDNSDLSEQIERLRKLNGCDGEDDKLKAELIKRLEEKNDALAQCIGSLQSDMTAFYNRTTAKGSSAQHECTGDYHVNFTETPKCKRTIVSQDMIDQLKRARAAVKETSSIIKAQRRALSSDTMPEIVQASSFFISSSDLSQSSSQYMVPDSSAKPPSEITAAVYNHDASQAISPTPSLDGSTNLLMKLEDEHMAEKSAIKTKYREKIRCMKKEWEGERKAILSLITSPGQDAYHVIKSSPNHHDGFHQKPSPGHILAKQTPGSTFCASTTGDSSYLETEAFVMNLLNELDS